MSYRVEGDLPSLLASEVAPGVWYVAVGVPDSDMPREMGFSGDEMEAEVLVQLSWRVAGSKPPFFLSSNPATLDRVYLETRSKAQVLDVTSIPYYMQLNSACVIRPVSIPSLRFAIYALGVYGNMVLSTDGVMINQALCVIDDGIGMIGSFHASDFIAVAETLGLHLSLSDELLADEPWVVEVMKTYETWAHEVLAELNASATQ